MTVAGVNIIPTVLFALSMLYWLIAILGIFDIEGLDFDFDSDGAAGHLFNFLKIGDVPMTIYMSILFLTFWALNMTVSLVTGSYGGIPNVVGIIPCFVVAALITKIITHPLKGLLKGLNGNSDEFVDFIGMVGVLKYDIAPDKTSQVILDNTNSLVTCIVKENITLKYGSKVKIIEKEENSNKYIVQPFQGLE